MRFVKPQMTQTKAMRPVDWLRRLVVAGIICGILIAGVIAALQTFEAKRECRGAFDGGFSNGFDRYYCNLRIKFIQAGSELLLRLP